MAENCWEVLNCGREAGGAKVKELGVCPASQEVKLSGVNNGTMAGRSCFAVDGTLCGATVQGNADAKRDNCNRCKFYKQVLREEGDSFLSAAHVIPLLRSKLLGWKLESFIVLSLITAMVIADYFWVNYLFQN